MPGIERDGTVSGVRPHHVHQAGARPIRGGIETGLGGFVAVLSIGGERCVDQPRIQRCQVGRCHAQPVAHRQRKVGDEHIGGGGQAMQHRLTLRKLQIERQTAFVARRQLPVVVDLLAGDRRRGPPWIAGAGGLDLDHVGAVVGHDRRRRRAGDPACAVDDFQAGEQAFGHAGHLGLDRMARMWGGAMG